MGKQEAAARIHVFMFMKRCGIYTTLTSGACFAFIFPAKIFKVTKVVVQTRSSVITGRYGSVFQYTGGQKRLLASEGPAGELSGEGDCVWSG